VQRVPAASIPAILIEVARLDGLAKGIGEGNVWDELMTVGLALAGTPALPLPARIT
jgi:hypothetical protein